MKPEYGIFKMLSKEEGGPEYWDGPFSTKKEAVETFLQSYWDEPGTFSVVRLSYEIIEVRRPRTALDSNSVKR